MVEPDQTLRPLNGGDDVDRMARGDRAAGRRAHAREQLSCPCAAPSQVLGYCVVVGVPRWTAELDERAREVADDFAVRLDTAVLFDDVRALATSEERNRIAREMHDGVAQEIVGLGYIVDEIESISDQDADPRARVGPARRDHPPRLGDPLLDLRPAARRSPTDVCPALSADYAREVSHATGLRVHLSLAESGPPLPPRTATEVLRVAQEAIGNVRRHAHADEPLGDLRRPTGRRSSLRVEDDGVGNAEPREHHWGLQTMRERAEGVGARLDVDAPTRRWNRRQPAVTR